MCWFWWLQSSAITGRTYRKDIYISSLIIQQIPSVGNNFRRMGQIWNWNRFRNSEGLKLVVIRLNDEWWLWAEWGDAVWVGCCIWCEQQLHRVALYSSVGLRKMTHLKNATDHPTTYSDWPFRGPDGSHWRGVYDFDVCRGLSSLYWTHTVYCTYMLDKASEHSQRSS